MNVNKSQFSIVLIHPEIPGNTGSIGRTAVALNLQLILIKPYGFDLSEKSVRRAGLDYWKHVNLVEYDTFEEFLNTENPVNEKMFFFSKTAKETYFKAKFTSGSYLIFGSETKGLSENILEIFKENLYSLPMLSDKVRSLNLANVATAAAYEAFRQIH